MMRIPLKYYFSAVTLSHINACVVLAQKCVLWFVTPKPELFFTTSGRLCYTDRFITDNSCRSAGETSYEVTNTASGLKVNLRAY